MKTVDPTMFDLEAFHAGVREVLEQVYREHLMRVERTVRRYCRGAEAECVIHDVFLAVVERPEVRQSFKGGDLGAWLATLAARRALDRLRRERRVTLQDPASLEGALEPVEEEASLLERDRARRLAAELERFAAEQLPGLDRRLAQVFDLRIVRRMSHMEAAAELGIPRTTLIDREGRLMKTLGHFLRRRLGSEP